MLFEGSTASSEYLAGVGFARGGGYESSNGGYGEWRQKGRPEEMKNRHVNRKTKSSGSSRNSSGTGTPIVCQTDGSYHLVQMSR